jgi:hypothetical protein
MLETLVMQTELAEKVVEDLKNLPQALKRRHIFNGVAARLKSGPSQNLPESYFFRNLWKRCATQNPSFSAVCYAVGCILAPLCGWSRVGCLPGPAHQIARDCGSLLKEAEDWHSYGLRQTQHAPDFRGCTEHGCKPPFIRRAIIMRGIGKRNVSREERNQALTGQTAAAQGKRNTVADEGVHKRGRIPSQQNPISLRFRLSKNQG